MKNFLTKNRKAFMVLFGNLFFLCLILISLKQFTSISIDKFIDYNLLINLNIFSLFAWLLFFIKNDEKFYRKKIGIFFQYCFFGFLIFTTIGSRQLNLFKNLNIYSDDFLKLLYSTVVLITICLGFISFELNQARIEKTSDNEKIEKNKKDGKFNVRSDEASNNVILKHANFFSIIQIKLASIFINLGKIIRKEGWKNILFILAILILFTAIKLPYIGLSFTGENSMKYNTYVEPAKWMVANNDLFMLNGNITRIRYQILPEN